MGIPWLSVTPQGTDCSKYLESDVCYGMGCITDRYNYKCRAVTQDDVNDTNPTNPPSCYTAGDYGKSQVNCESRRDCIWDSSNSKGICRYKKPNEKTQAEIDLSTCAGYKIQQDCAKATQCGTWNPNTNTCYPKGSTLGTPISELKQTCKNIYNKDQCINVQNCVWDLPTSTCLEPSLNTPAGTITGLETGCKLLKDKNMCFVTGCYWEGSECRAPTPFEVQFLKVSQFALNNEILYPIITASTAELAHEKLWDSKEKLDSDKNSEMLWNLLKGTAYNVLKIEIIPEDKKLMFEGLLAGVDELHYPKPNESEEPKPAEPESEPKPAEPEPEPEGLSPLAIGLIIGGVVLLLIGLIFALYKYSNSEEYEESIYGPEPQPEGWDLGTQYGPPQQGYY